MRFWNTQENELMVVLEEKIEGENINLIDFSENGYILAAGNEQ